MIRDPVGSPRAWLTGGHSPAQGDFDRGGEAGGEQVGREVRDHGQELAGLTGCQLDAVLHGRGQGHLGERVVRVDGGNLQENGEH